MGRRVQASRTQGVSAIEKKGDAQFIMVCTFAVDRLYYCELYYIEAAPVTKTLSNSEEAMAHFA